MKYGNWPITGLETVISFTPDHKWRLAAPDVSFKLLCIKYRYLNGEAKGVSGRSIQESARCFNPFMQFNNSVARKGKLWILSTILTMHFALVVPLSVQKVGLGWIVKLHCVIFQVATLVESLN